MSYSCILGTVNHSPVGAGPDRDLLPRPEGAAPVGVVHLVGGLAGLAAENLLGLQNSPS